jgi:hypothetical protein
MQTRVMSGNREGWTEPSSLVCQRCTVNRMMRFDATFSLCTQVLLKFIAVLAEIM